MTTPLDRLHEAILDRFLAGERIFDLAQDYSRSMEDIGDCIRLAIRERLREEEE